MGRGVKRLFSVALALTMLFSLFPATVTAQEAAEAVEAMTEEAEAVEAVTTLEDTAAVLEEAAVSEEVVTTLEEAGATEDAAEVLEDAAVDVAISEEALTALEEAVEDTSAALEDAAEVSYVDGVYQGTAAGYLSDITVSVTIENGQIKAVESVSNGESPMFFQMASAVMASIVERQTPDVDTVSGATYSSTGIINAVKQALERAIDPNAETYTEPQADWFAGGSGTQTDPFLIRTKAQLERLSATVDDVIDYAGYFVKLDADLDLSGADWATIGGGVYAFNGTFDGADHTISGLTLGSDSQPYTLDSAIRTIGLFGILGPQAAVRNLNLTDVQANVQSEGQIRLGALAGHANGDEDNHGGAIVDHCSVKGGSLKAETQAAGNSFVGGLVGYLTGGAIINSMTDVEVVSTTKYWYAEAGGISAINNAGLVANCYALGTSTGNDGGGVDTDVAASVLVGMQMGDLVNCYADGDIYANEPSRYSGAVSGWVTDGRSYNSWYNGESVLELGGVRETMKAYGAKDNPTMDYEGLFYVNNMVRELNACTASTKSAVADSLNANFSAFPIDISVYGVGSGDLRAWTYDSESGEIALTDTMAAVTYVMPEDENVPQVDQPMKDGVWYGRDEEKTVVVRITVSDDQITEADVLRGSESGDAYEAALKRARDKAVYGDTTDYEAVDTSSLQGSGTEADPYRISSAADLRLIAQAINEDQSWENVYFQQTADIDVSDAEWLPIGWAIQGYYRSRWTQFCEYPFEGHYDGGGFCVTGVRIGAPDAPTSDTRKAYTAGFFGVTRGTVTDNYAIQPDARLATVKNLRLRNVAIYSASHSNNYAGGLIAEPASGFRVDQCSVEGTVSAHADVGVVYAGGLMGYALRGGLVTNVWTNVDVSAFSSRDSDGGNVYAGGLYGYDNRVTTVNAYTLGSVRADGKENSVMAGGVSGCNGGAHYNTYALGSITAENATNYIGGLDGWLPAIGADYHGYYNVDAVQNVNGVSLTEKKAVGVSSQAEERDHTESRSETELHSAAFVETLNANRERIADELGPMQEAIGYHPLHTVYYTGDGSDLGEWILDDGTVSMKEAAASEQGTYVLMNIPYADFYAAELGDGAPVADTVTSATPKAYNPTLTAGSYHDGETATDILGVTYPVKVSDLSVLTGDRYTEITDLGDETADSLLFSSSSYTWYRLDEQPSAYKMLNDDGSFTAVSARSEPLSDIHSAVTLLTRRGDYEIELEGENLALIEDSTVLGVVLTTEKDGVVTRYGLRQLENIWKQTELALFTGHTTTIKDGALTPKAYEDLEGASISRLTYYVKDTQGRYRIYTIDVDLPVQPYPTAAFEDADTVTIHTLSAEDTARTLVRADETGDDQKSFRVSVYSGTGEEKTYLAENVYLNEDGSVSLSSPATSGTTYTVEMKRYRVRNGGARVDEDVLIPMSATYSASAAEPTPTPTSSVTPVPTPTPSGDGGSAQQGGCYVATAVYGSYDCPEVWTLRRFRDEVLAETWYGRLFIRLYYAVSPTAVKLFGESEWFQNFFRARLDKMVSGLQADGFASTPYQDQAW